MARVAVVEDDPNVRTLFVRLLESADLQPAVYDSGDAFLNSGQAGSFDVVVTDFQMPGASGLDVLRSCRAEPDPPEVLLVTGVGTIPNAVEAMRMGAFDYLAKPVPARELIHRVGLALEARRLRQDVVRRRTSQPIDAEMLQEAIRQCHGNRLQAAKRLGISRATFYRLLARTGSKPKDNSA